MGLSSNRGKAKADPTGTTVIAAGTRFDGELKPAGELQLDGILIGKVDSGKDVTVGPEGSFEGTLCARSVVVKGHVRGRVVCEKLQILPAGMVSGEVHSEMLIITPGGRFHGESRERGPEAAANTDESADAQLRTLAF